MKLKLDENLPESLLDSLAKLGHDADNVRIESLVGQNDPVVWRAAQDAGRVFVTQDLDFSDIRQFAPGSHCGLILVRMKLPGKEALKDRLKAVFAITDCQTWSGCFVVVTDVKVRVHRPAGDPQA